MIGAFLEGVGQSLLPCSWILLVPAIGIGLLRPSPRVAAAMVLASIAFAWLAVGGWWVVPLPVSGAMIAAGAALWWIRDLDIFASSLIGAGAASAWQPCVGPDLGAILNQAQTDPVGAIPGLAAFLVGVLAVGLLIGWAGGRFLQGRALRVTTRFVALAMGCLGLTMVVGWYPTVASALASWSYSLWA